MLQHSNNHNNKENVLEKSKTKNNVKNLIFGHIPLIIVDLISTNKIPVSIDLLSELAFWTSVCGFGCAGFGSDRLWRPIISGGGEVAVKLTSEGPGNGGAAWECVFSKVSTASCWDCEKDSKDCMAPVKVSWCLTSWRTHFDRPERRGHQRLKNI